MNKINRINPKNHNKVTCYLEIPVRNRINQTLKMIKMSTNRTNRKNQGTTKKLLTLTQ